MSGDVMSFPSNWWTFVQQYQFADKDEVYTNGSMLIPSFRVRQMVEHYFGGKVGKTSRYAELFGTSERAEWFRSFVPGHTEPEISAEHERLYGFPLSESQIGNAKTKLGVRSGTHGGRFEKGQAAWNKGRKQSEFMSPEAIERTKATRFQKGQVSGIAKERMKPVGYERVDAKDGYVWVKVKDTPQAQVPGSYNDNFRLKHHVVWEEANGTPVPPHTMIVFADRDKRNFDPENLVAVPRSLWSVISRQGWAYHDRESLEACMALAQLNRKVYEARLHPRNCKRCGAEFKPRYPHQRTCDGCLGR